MALVLHWKLDEGTGTSAADSSGNGRTGTLTNGPTWTAGKFGSAVQFDGSDDYIDAGDVLDMGTGSYSFGCWVKMPSTGSGEDWILSKKSDGGSGAGWALLFITASNGLEAKISDGTNSVNTAATSAIDNDVWRHLFVVADRVGNTQKVYVDGVEAASASISTVTGSTSNAIAFRAGRAGGAVEPFLGAIDDVRVYDTALSAAAVLAIAQEVIRNEMSIMGVG